MRKMPKLDKPELQPICTQPKGEHYGWTLHWKHTIVDLFEDGSVHLSYAHDDERKQKKG